MPLKLWDATLNAERDMTPDEEAVHIAAQTTANQPDLPAYAADARWRKEVGGFIFAGLTIATDDRSKTMIMGARIKADQNPTFSTRWKMPDGTFTTIPAETIIAVSDAVLDHVNACFELESDVLAEIAGGTITTTAEIDAIFFPPGDE